SFNVERVAHGVRGLRLLGSEVPLPSKLQATNVLPFSTAPWVISGLVRATATRDPESTSTNRHTTPRSQWRKTEPTGRSLEPLGIRCLVRRRRRYG
ncbi:MAG: hypothetical protein WBC63_03135, partial [Candidatus Bipolaricaulia bacterium]